MLHAMESTAFLKNRQKRVREFVFRFLPAWLVVTVTDTAWSWLGFCLDTPFTAQTSKV